MHQDMTVSERVVRGSFLYNVSFREKRNAISQRTGREGCTGWFAAENVKVKAGERYQIGGAEMTAPWPHHHDHTTMTTPWPWPHLPWQGQGTMGLTTLESQHQVRRNQRLLSSLLYDARLVTLTDIANIHWDIFVYCFIVWFT